MSSPAIIRCQDLPLVLELEGYSIIPRILLASNSGKSEQNLRYLTLGLSSVC